MTQAASQSTTTMAQLLRPLFVALPIPRGIEPDDLLRGYLVALEGEDFDAMKSVVVKLIKGTWHEEVTFCPRPPELANMVRAEHRRNAAVNRLRLPPPAIVQKPYRNLAEVHRERADELKANGYVLFQSDVTHDGYVSLVKMRKLPVGATHLSAISEVWAPEGAEMLQPSPLGEIEDKEAAE